MKPTWNHRLNGAISSTVLSWHVLVALPPWLAPGRCRQQRPPARSLFYDGGTYQKQTKNRIKSTLIESILAHSCYFMIFHVVAPALASPTASGAQFLHHLRRDHCHSLSSLVWKAQQHSRMTKLLVQPSIHASLCCPLRWELAFQRP